MVFTVLIFKCEIDTFWQKCKKMHITPSDSEICKKDLKWHIKYATKAGGAFHFTCMCHFLGCSQENGDIVICGQCVTQCIIYLTLCYTLTTYDSVPIFLVSFVIGYCWLDQYLSPVVLPCLHIVTIILLVNTRQKLLTSAYSYCYQVWRPNSPAFTSFLMIPQNNCAKTNYS